MPLSSCRKNHGAGLWKLILGLIALNITSCILEAAIHYVVGYIVDIFIQILMRLCRSVSEIGH
jgi:hypothetical protein